MVSNTLRPHFTPGKDQVSVLQEAGWAPGSVWTDGKSRPHRDSIPDRPSPSQSLYSLKYSAHIFKSLVTGNVYYFRDVLQTKRNVFIEMADIVLLGRPLLLACQRILAVSKRLAG